MKGRKKIRRKKVKTKKSGKRLKTEKTAKPGVRTSEFWLAALGVLAPVLNEKAGGAISGIGPGGLLAVAVTASAYAIGRSLVKRGR